MMELDAAAGDRREPRGMTLADLMVAVAGLAVGFVMLPVRPETTRVMQSCAYDRPVVAYTSSYWTAARLALPVGLALGMVILIRRARFGGLPRPGEWLALVLTLVLIDVALPRDDHVLGPITTQPFSEEEVEAGSIPVRYNRPSLLVGIDDQRPLVPALPLQLAIGLAVVPAAWAARRLARKGEAGAGMLLMIAWAWVWLRMAPRLNPVEFARFRYSWITLPPAPPPPPFRTLREFEWHLEARLALGRWLLGLLIAAPAIATVCDLLRHGSAGRRWTEWAAATLAAALGACWAIDELVLRPDPPAAVRAVVFLMSGTAVVLPALGLARWGNGLTRSGQDGCNPRPLSG